MNRRVAFVTALSIVGTITAATVSLVVVYEPTDVRSAGVPLLDSTIALAEASASTPTTVVPSGASTLAPTQPDPAARVVTGTPLTAAPVESGAATGPTATGAASGSGSGSRVPPPAAPSPFWRGPEPSGPRTHHPDDLAPPGAGYDCHDCHDCRPWQPGEPDDRRSGDHRCTSATCHDGRPPSRRRAR